MLCSACAYAEPALVMSWLMPSRACLRLVAERCLYGVDRNPMAVDLARLSLWLATLAREHEFSFLDHALKAGDSLVGLTQSEIAAAHWDATKPGLPLFREPRVLAAHLPAVSPGMLRDQFPFDEFVELVQVNVAEQGR